LVKSFRTTDLKALLEHDDPQGGTEVKGNKAQLLERVMALVSVKLAIATYPDSSPARSQALPVTQTLTPALRAPTTLPISSWVHWRVPRPQPVGSFRYGVTTTNVIDISKVVAMSVHIPVIFIIFHAAVAKECVIEI
jgi:hypothetical protein